MSTWKNIHCRPVQAPRSAKEEMLLCCMFSSLRGASRIVRSRSRFWRVCWIISVVAFLSGVLISIFFLTVQYLLYNDIEIVRPVLQHSLPFPAVTICNLKPFSYNKLHQLIFRNTTIELLVKRILHAYQLHKELFGDSGKRTMFFSSLGLSYSRLLGHKKDEFIVNGTCFYTKRSSWQSATTSCQPKYIIQHPNFFNCYMFEPPVNTSNITLSLEMVLHLDTDEPIRCHDDMCVKERKMIHDEWDISSIGARVLLHSPGTYPQIEDNGVDLLPGTKSTIEFRPTEQHLLSTPIKQCIAYKSSTELVGVTRLSRNETNYWSNRTEHSFIHTTSMCQGLIMQERLASTCGCVDARSSLTQSQASLPFCLSLATEIQTFDQPPSVAGDMRQFKNFSHHNVTTNETCANNKNLSDWWSGFEKRALCALNLIKQRVFNAEECKLSCWWLRYDSKVHQSKWPPKHKELDFFDTYLKDNDIGRKYYAFDQIGRLTKKNITAARNLLKQNSLISENFLRVKVFRPDFSAVITSESLVMSSSQYLSQVGGMLSLWCGLSIITFVEIMELVYYLTIRFNNWIVR